MEKETLIGSGRNQGHDRNPALARIDYIEIASGQDLSELERSGARFLSPWL
jgi:hypothetical protein